MNRAEVYVDYFKTFYRLADERCRRYWGTDRPNGQAAGLESLVCFGGMAVGLRRPMVVDAGAGASSAILRTYFRDVVTCDPDAEYLEQVRRACEALGLGHGQWIAGVPSLKADVCFYDYGTKERIPLLADFLRATRSLFWLDDAHDANLLAHANTVCLEDGLVLRTAPNSVDEYGRFGAYAVR